MSESLRSDFLGDLGAHVFVVMNWKIKLLKMQSVLHQITRHSFFLIIVLYPDHCWLYMSGQSFNAWWFVSHTQKQMNLSVSAESQLLCLRLYIRLAHISTFYTSAYAHMELTVTC